MSILSGLFISTFTNIIQQRVEAVESGTVTYKSIHNHTVVIGFCDLTHSVIKGILEKKGEQRKVILLTNCDMVEIQKALYNITHDEDYEGQVVVYSGDYRLSDNLDRLNLEYANNVYILGDDEVDSRDFENIACAQKVSNIITSKGENDTPTPLYVRMDRMPSFSTLQRLDLHTENFSTKVYFRPFNFYEHWTRLLWVKQSIKIDDIAGNKVSLNYPSLLFDANINSQKYVHLVVSGFSQMGMALALYALRAAHYGNYTEKNNLKTKITVVDPQMNVLRPMFESQYQHLEQIYDVEIEYLDCLFEDISPKIVEWSCDKQQMLTIAICINDADAALSQALNMPLEVYYQHGRNSRELPRILVRQKHLSGIWKILGDREHNELVESMKDAKAFRKTNYNKYHNIFPFGMLIGSFYPEELDDRKAYLVHADYEDTWVYTDKDESKKVTISHLHELVMKHDDDQLKLLAKDALQRWLLQSENTKWANRYQTDSHHILLDYLNALGIDSIEKAGNSDYAISLCSDIEHRRWVGERVTSGWQQSPFVKDGKPMRQDSLLLHYDITQTSNIGAESAKDISVVRNVLMLDEICNYLNNII